MDTWVNVQVVSAWPRARVQAAVHRALEWLAAVERAVSRFEPDSEIMSLLHGAGKPMPVSALVFEAVDFAVTLARLTNGVFDPTVGGRLEQHGFNQSYRTGLVMDTGLGDRTVSYRDVQLDRTARTLTLRQPLLLDLGAIAKGLAVDLVSRELAAQGFRHFSVDAGGDVSARGLNARGTPWQIGI
jgi:thiamine biosynthesis lipoprotein